MARDFLLEIGLEEMPARFIDPALDQLKDLASSILKENRLKFEEVYSLGTPRRLAVVVKGLEEKQESLVKEVKGPALKVAIKDGKPTKAAEGFAKSQGVSIDELVTKSVGPVEYLYAVIKEEGNATEQLLEGLAPKFITGLNFPKPMRWGNLDFRFARPIRWLVALYGERVIPFELAGLKAGNISYAHRFLSSGPVIINSPDEYIGLMAKEYVLIDPKVRKERIRKQIEELATEAGGIIYSDEELLSEVNNLVEYPVAVMGSFETSYLELPPEVLITPMKEHQRYFPVQDASGKLLPRFITVANAAINHLDIVRAGNEKVLKARLEDAAFFWREDLKETLDSRVEALNKVVFLEGLGTMYQKVERISDLSEYIVKSLGGDAQSISDTIRAARLAKADLVTNMVYEFPELQGVMGKEYALRSGEKAIVAQAIYEHYLPRHAGDQLPQSLPGKALSFADKLDTLVGCFGIGIQPTGSQDPYALRRQALAICNIILDYGPGVLLSDMIKQAYRGLADRVELRYSEEKVTGDIIEFFRQRLRGLFGDKGFSYDVIEAILASGFDDLADAHMRGRAVEEFRSNPAFSAMLNVYTRASNLANKAEVDKIDMSLLEDETEKKLYSIFSGLEKEVQSHTSNQEYLKALEKISELQEPLNEFFEKVMVMVDDLDMRNNRLALLKRISGCVGTVADFSKLVT